MAALWTNLTGGDVIKPEFKLTKGPLLILVDDPRSLVVQPSAVRALHQGLSRRFLEYHVNHRVIPMSEGRRLQQTDRRYDKLSIREVGEKLGADQVLYLRVEGFTLHGEKGAPLFKGEFTVRVKVLSTKPVHDNRLWPRERAGRHIAVSTPSTSMEGERGPSDVAEELGTKLARQVAELFYEHREFAE